MLTLLQLPPMSWDYKHHHADIQIIYSDGTFFIKANKMMIVQSILQHHMNMWADILQGRLTDLIFQDYREDCCSLELNHLGYI